MLQMIKKGNVLFQASSKSHPSYLLESRMIPSSFIVGVF